LTENLLIIHFTNVSSYVKAGYPASHLEGPMSIEEGHLNVTFGTIRPVQGHIYLRQIILKLASK